MKKRVYIVHGWEGSPENDWFPWLKKELDRISVEVKFLAMPNPKYPIMSEWIDTLDDAIGSADEMVYMIGHSLGCITILRYLEALTNHKKIGGAILVAGFPESININELDTFFETPLDYKKVKESSRAFVAIHSDNDPYVPMENGELLRERLDSELILMKGAGHISASDGYIKLPIVLEKLKELMAI